MQKRANSASGNISRRGTALIAVIALALVGIAAGGTTVGTGATFYGGAEAKVETSIARQGPKGTAAEISTPSDG